MVSDPRLLELGNLEHLALLEPAAALQQRDPSARVVILIDALDELVSRPSSDSLIGWLGALAEVPSNVRFLAQPALPRR